MYEQPEYSTEKMGRDVRPIEVVDKRMTDALAQLEMAAAELLTRLNFVMHERDDGDVPRENSPRVVQAPIIARYEDILASVGAVAARLQRATGSLVI